MVRALIICLCLIWAAGASAQNWSVWSDDNGGYAVASVGLEVPSMSMSCHARSVQNLPLFQTGWHESTVAPPYHFIFGFTQNLIDTWIQQRRDLILFVDQTGYQLPLTQWNEMEGGWEVKLPMSDPIFAAMNSATRLVLQVGSEAAWEFPVNGLAASLEEARQYCANTWVRTGYPAPHWFGPVTGAAPPLPTSTGFQIPQQVLGYANTQCEGNASIEPSALKGGDLDRDGLPDVVLDWRGVTCPGSTMNLFCGAANCSIDVFMSSRSYLRPLQMLGMGPTIAPAPTGQLGLFISGTWSLCGENGCDAPWVWNGTTLVQMP